MFFYMLFSRLLNKSAITNSRHLPSLTKSLNQERPPLQQSTRPRLLAQPTRKVVMQQVIILNAHIRRQIHNPFLRLINSREIHHEERNLMAAMLVLPFHPDVHATLGAEVALHGLDPGRVGGDLLSRGRREEFEVGGAVGQGEVGRAQFLAEGAVAAGCCQLVC